MEEILDKYQKLNKTQQQLLLTFADNLLLQQQLEHSKGDLSEWKKSILNVSVWSEDSIPLSFI